MVGSGFTVATLAALLVLMRRMITVLRSQLSNPLVATYLVPPLTFGAVGSLGYILNIIIQVTLMSPSSNIHLIFIIVFCSKSTVK